MQLRQSRNTRLGRDTLLFTDVTQSLETRIGRNDATSTTRQLVDAMRQQFGTNGGETVELEGLLVMRRFIQRVMGSDVVDSIIGELAAVEALEESGAPSDSLFFADYEEASNSKTHRVHCLLRNPTTQKARNMASIWTMQDHPLVAQTGGAKHAPLHGRKVYWCVCLNTCQLQWNDDNVELYRGDVYVKHHAPSLVHTL